MGEHDIIRGRDGHAELSDARIHLLLHDHLRLCMNVFTTLCRYLLTILFHVHEAIFADPTGISKAKPNIKGKGIPKMLGTANSTIYLFGDSITQHGYDPLQLGWVSLLSHAYQRRLTVLNAGLSGYSSDQALDILPRFLPTPEQCPIRLLVIFFGANDARLPGTGVCESPEQYVPKEKFKQNLRGICTSEGVRMHRESESKTKILLVTPPPIDEHLLVRKNREARIAAEYAAQVRVLAKELASEGLEVRCLDIWTAFMKKCGWGVGDPLLGSKDVPPLEKGGLKDLLSDGLHLNKGGNKLLFQKMMGVIRKEWPELCPEAVPFGCPVWLDQKAWKEVFEKRREDEE